MEWKHRELFTKPLMRVVDLDVGEPAAEVVLHNGTTARIELLERSKVSDSVRGGAALPHLGKCVVSEG